MTELDGTTVGYTYDALYRLTGETRVGTTPFSHTYDYDLAGNVTTLDGNTFATYDAANKFSSLTGGTYSYDASGNLTAVSGAGLSAGTFTYESRENMDSQISGSNAYGYRYDPFGKRVRAIYNTGPAVYYVFDGDRLIGEVSSTGAKAAYTWGPDGIVSVRLISSGKSLYYHFGPQGEARQLTTTGGSVADSYLYTAYGVNAASSGTDYNPHRYGGKVGYYTEGVFGLMLASHRWYSPNLMRWMTRDPIEYEGGENLGVYAFDDPVNRIDPSGLDSWANTFAGVGAALGGTAGGLAGAAGAAATGPGAAVDGMPLVGAGIAGGAALGGGTGYYFGKGLDVIFGTNQAAECYCPMARYERGQKNQIYFDALLAARGSGLSICKVLAAWREAAEREGNTARVLAIVTAEKVAGCRNERKRKS